jgi:hypothetical protein
MWNEHFCSFNWLSRVRPNRSVRATLLQLMMLPLIILLQTVLRNREQMD